MGNTESREFSCAGGAQYKGTSLAGENIPHGNGTMTYAPTCGSHHSRCGCPAPVVNGARPYVPSGFPAMNAIASYEGGFANGARDGNGLATYYHLPSGGLQMLSYAGGWKRDLMDGHGVAILTDESRYEGDGNGILIQKNGYYYEGGWSNGKKCGYGVETLTDGSRYEGGWINNRR